MRPGAGKFSVGAAPSGVCEEILKLGNEKGKVRGAGCCERVPAGSGQSRRGAGRGGKGSCEGVRR